MRQEKFSSLRKVKIKAENLEKKFRALRKLQPLKNHGVKKANGGKVGSTSYKPLPALVDRLNRKENYCSVSCIKKSHCENCLKSHNFVEDKSVSDYRDERVRELLLNFNLRCLQRVREFLLNVNCTCLQDSKIKKANSNCIVEKNENNQTSTSFKTVSSYIDNYSDPRKKAVSTLKNFQKLPDDDDFFSELQNAQDALKKVSRKFKYQKLKKKVALPPIRQEPLKKTAKVPIELNKVNIKTSGGFINPLCKVQKLKVIMALEDKTILQSERSLTVLPMLGKPT